jgi:hypothetical protein
MDSARASTSSRSRRGVRRWLVALLAAAGLVVPATASAEDPLFVEWTSLAPSLTAGYDPTSENDCVRGHVRCVDAVIREMTRRFNNLAEDCDHDAMFALAYLRTTEEYRRTVEDPTFFEDTAFVNHEDAVFAEYYFDAYDDWHRGRTEQVPPAWRIAFQASDDRSVTGYGDMALGMNAHIQRDLPFVLEGIGLVKPDGSTRKTDHDRVNQFLNRVADDLLPELAARFDPTVDDDDLPGQFDDIVKFQLVPAWRETAWRNAERLANAPTPAARAQVAADIEAYAASAAQALKTQSLYGPLRSSAERDAYCAAHG